jgi:hypothetical protein
LVNTELTEAQRLCAELGDGEHWAAAVGLNDAMTTYRDSDNRVYRAARDVGITDEQFRFIKRGDGPRSHGRTAPATTGTVGVPGVDGLG